MGKLIITAAREAYRAEDIRCTMTAGELIEFLEQFDKDTRVYIGNDRIGENWCTFGGVREWEIEGEE